MKTKKIIFESQNEDCYEFIQKPIPASQLIPQWWKDIPKYSDSNKIELSPLANVTVKQCAPTIDILQSGYILTLWSDIIITQIDGLPYATWPGQERVLDAWSPKQTSFFEIPDGYSKLVFKYLHKWIIKTPPGWSTIFTQPFGYKNSVTNAIPGIVDTDILKTEINCPFVIKDGFEGVIKKGTPIVQVIPIKREKWEMECVPGSQKKYNGELNKLATEIYGYYSSRRNKKSYK